MTFPYDEEIIRLFVPKDRQERLLWKLVRPERRDEAMSAMTNAIEFAPRCMTSLPKKPKLEEVHALLIDKGAGENAYIFTSNQDIHGTTIPLLDALKRYIGQNRGTLIYCPEGQVGYYEADGLEEYFLVHKAGLGK